MSRLCVFETTEPRDIVYALLAIAKDTFPPTSDPNTAIPEITALQQKRLSAWGQRHIAAGAYRVDYQLPVVDVYRDFIEFSIRKSEPSRALDIICRPWAPRILPRGNAKWNGGAMNGATANAATDKENLETELFPSWIPDLDGAAFTMNEHPTAGSRMERQNADPLVGMPGIGQRNYSAAGTRSVSLNKLKFKRRKHCYSMFVEGFIFDKVRKVEEPSRIGNIPINWQSPGGWANIDGDPPPEFWRTIVADRGPSGQNPPTFYPRACTESHKKKIGNIVDTKQLINEGRCTIIAEFLRRVQAVIWNRRLMRTKQEHLGLVHEDALPGDSICVLYGCSVPVVLRKFQKSDEDLERDREGNEQEKQNNIHKALNAFKANAKDKPRLKRLQKLQKEQESQRLKNFVRYCFNHASFLWLTCAFCFIKSWRNPNLAMVLVASGCIVVLAERLWKPRVRQPYNRDPTRNGS